MCDRFCIIVALSLFLSLSPVPLTFSNLIYNTTTSSSFYQINDVTSVKIELPPGGGTAFLDCTPSKPTPSTPTWLECHTCTDVPGNEYVKIVRADKDTAVVVCQVNSVVRTFSFKVTDATGKLRFTMYICNCTNLCMIEPPLWCFCFVLIMMKMVV